MEPSGGEPGDNEVAKKSISGQEKTSGFKNNEIKSFEGNNPSAKTPSTIDFDDDSVLSDGMAANSSIFSTPSSQTYERSKNDDENTPLWSNDSGIHIDKSTVETELDRTTDILNTNGIISNEIKKDNELQSNLECKNSSTVNNESVKREAKSTIQQESYEEKMEAMVTEEIKGAANNSGGTPGVEEFMSTESPQPTTDNTTLHNKEDAEEERIEENERQSQTTPAANQSSSDVDAAIDDVIRLRRRLRRRRPDSDSSSSSDESSSDDIRLAGPGDVEASDDDDDEKAEEEELEEEEEKPRPKDAWNPLKRLYDRERGYSHRLDVSHMFRTQCGASLNLVRRLELQSKLDHHQGCVNALHFNKSGTLLASGSDDLDIAVWDWRKDEPFFVFESGHRANVFQCKFMPYTGDTHIVSCARDGQVRLAELSSTGVCKGTKKLAQHRGSAHKLALLEDSSHEFYSCGEDAVVFQMDLRESKPQKLCTAKENGKKIPLYSIHTNPFKSYEFCTGGRDHFIRVFDKRMVNNDDGECTVKKFCPHNLVDSKDKANVTCAVFNWNGTEVIGTYNDDDIYMFDNEMSAGAEYIHRYRGHRNNATVKGVNYYGPRSEFIVSGSDCGHVFLWDKDSERVVNFMHADTGGVVNVLEPHPHMPLLATSGLDNDVKLFMPTAKEPTTLKGLAKRARRNRKERESERTGDSDMMDGRMLWFLMQHLRRTRRSRPTGGGDGDDDDNSDNHSDSERDSENDSAESDGGNPVECIPS